MYDHLSKDSIVSDEMCLCQRIASTIYWVFLYYTHQHYNMNIEEAPISSIIFYLQHYIILSDRPFEVLPASRYSIQCAVADSVTLNLTIQAHPAPTQCTWLLYSDNGTMAVNEAHLEMLVRIHFFNI